jgi:hypothetical protein
MGSVGDACDNRLCESFFASLECELLDRRLPLGGRSGRLDFAQGFPSCKDRYVNNEGELCGVSCFQSLLR